MLKYKFITEYEFEYDSEQIFPYLTVEGLGKWFAEKISPLEDKTYDMVWDRASHVAKIIAFRENSYIKYQFHEKDEKRDFSYIDFRLSKNQLTETIFLKITDYSDMTDEKELHKLWDMLIHELREAIEDDAEWEYPTRREIV